MCVVSETGKPCLEVTAAEKGETTIVLTAFNATRSYSATMIYKGASLRDEWCLGCPENVVAKVSENGWINSDLFLEWGKMFVKQLPKEDLRPHLLLLYGHNSHVYNIYITFTFVHLADAFIQSDLHCILSYSFTFYQLLLSLGIEAMILALLAPCSTI